MVGDIEITTLLGDTINPEFLKPIKFDGVNDSGYYLYWENDTDQPRVFSKRVFSKIASNKKEIIREKSSYIISGYLSYYFGNQSDGKSFRLHRLVLLVKTGDFKKFEKSSVNFVNHIDGNKLNNSPSNLEWSNPSHNAKHAINTGLRKILKGENNRNSEKYICFNEVISKKFNTKYECINFLGCSKYFFNNSLKLGIEINGFSVKREEKTFEDITGEVWKEIPSARKARVIQYCSSEGRIKSIQLGTNTTKILEPSKKRTYAFIKTIDRFSSVHSLVARLFLGDKPDKNYIINHKDGNKFNNSASNLEYCSKSENCKHAYRIGLSKNNRSINQYSLEGKYIKTFPSISQASLETGCCYKNISAVCLGKRDSANGYMFKLYNGDTGNISPYKGKGKQIEQYDLSGNFIRHYISIKEASEYLRLNRCGIGRACSGKRKTFGGFIFKLSN